MTALMLDDELFRRASETAAAQGKTVDQFVREVVERGVGECVRLTYRNGLPVMVVGDDVPAIDPQLIRQILEEEGF